MASLIPVGALALSTAEVISGFLLRSLDDLAAVKSALTGGGEKKRVSVYGDM